MVPLPRGIRVPPPEQRAGYEKALGEFLVAFNAAENILRELVELSLVAVGNAEFSKQLKGSSLVEQARYMTLMSMANPRLPRIPFDAVLELNKERNSLAHGHFFEHLDREGYKIVEKHKERQFPVKAINALAQRANDMTTDLEFDYMRLLSDMDPSKGLFTPA